MANRERTNKAIRHFLTVVGTAYGGKVTTANAARKAQLIGTTKESFVTSSHRLGLIVEGASLATVTITDGTRTAAQVATDINNASVGVTAADDGQGRVQITSDTAPTATQPSHVEIAAPASGTDAAGLLGFAIGQMERRAALVDPGPTGFVWGPSPHRSLPEWEILSAGWAAVPNIRQGIDEIDLTMAVRDFDPSGNAQASVELIERHMAILDEIIADDRDMENQFIVSELVAMSASPDVWRGRPGGDFAQAVRWAEGTAKVRIKVYNY